MNCTYCHATSDMKQNQYLAQQFHTISQRSVHGTDEGVSLVLTLHGATQRLGLGHGALDLRFHWHRRTLVRDSFGFPPLL